MRWYEALPHWIAAACWAVVLYYVVRMYLLREYLPGLLEEVLK